MAKKHWENSDFVVTQHSDIGRYGYCRKCGADMQAFKSSGYKPLHYNSHKNIKRNGIIITKVS